MSNWFTRIFRPNRRQQTPAPTMTREQSDAKMEALLARPYLLRSSGPTRIFDCSTAEGPANLKLEKMGEGIIKISGTINNKKIEHTYNLNKHGKLQIIGTNFNDDIVIDDNIPAAQITGIDVGKGNDRLTLTYNPDLNIDLTEGANTLSTRSATVQEYRYASMKPMTVQVSNLSQQTFLDENNSSAQRTSRDKFTRTTEGIAKINVVNSTATQNLASLEYGTSSSPEISTNNRLFFIEEADEEASTLLVPVSTEPTTTPMPVETNTQKNKPEFKSLGNSEDGSLSYSLLSSDDRKTVTIHFTEAILADSQRPIIKAKEDGTIEISRQQSGTIIGTINPSQHGAKHLQIDLHSKSLANPTAKNIDNDFITIKEIPYSLTINAGSGHDIFFLDAPDKVAGINDSDRAIMILGQDAQRATVYLKAESTDIDSPISLIRGYNTVALNISTEFGSPILAAGAQQKPIYTVETITDNGQTIRTNYQAVKRNGSVELEAAPLSH